MHASALPTFPAISLTAAFVAVGFGGCGCTLTTQATVSGSVTAAAMETSAAAPSARAAVAADVAAGATAGLTADVAQRTVQSSEPLPPL